MPNWTKMKKMAEAFGRARELHPNKNPVKGRTLDDGTLELTQKADSPLDDAQFAPSRREDPAVEEAYLRGIEQGREINRAINDASISAGGSTPEERETWRHWGEDRLTNENLKQNISDEWDEAFARRKQGVRDLYGKDYPQDMAEEAADAFEKDLWRVIDELRNKGMTGNDILDMLRVDKPKGPYGE